MTFTYRTQPDEPPDIKTIQKQMAIVAWQPGANRVVETPSEVRSSYTCQVASNTCLAPAFCHGPSPGHQVMSTLPLLTPALKDSSWVGWGCKSPWPFSTQGTPALAANPGRRVGPTQPRPCNPPSRAASPTLPLSTHASQHPHWALRAAALQSGNSQTCSCTAARLLMLPAGWQEEMRGLQPGEVRRRQPARPLPPARQTRRYGQQAMGQSPEPEKVTLHTYSLQPDPSGPLLCDCLHMMWTLRSMAGRPCALGQTGCPSRELSELQLF